MNDITISVASPSEIMAMERVERNALLDTFLAAPLAIGPSSTARWERAGSYALIGEKSVPISEFNRCMGLGVDGAFTEGDLDQAIAWLDRYASPNFSIQLPPMAASREITRWIERRGLEPAGTGWARFFRPLDSSVQEVAAPTGLIVRQALPAEGAHFGATIIGGFGLAEIAGPWFASLTGRAGWRIYLAYDQEFPVACGALYIDGDWGWMGCDTTLQEFRGRGAQTALIQRRIADAAALGVKGLAAETGQPLPGMEHSSTSYRNYQKCGFVKAYTRPNYRRS